MCASQADRPLAMTTWSVVVIQHLWNSINDLWNSINTIYLWNSINDLWNSIND